MLSTEAATAAVESAHANYAPLNSGRKICRGRIHSCEQGLTLHVEVVFANSDTWIARLDGHLMSLSSLILLPAT